jgi:hypothetical protein
LSFLMIKFFSIFFFDFKANSFFFLNTSDLSVSSLMKFSFSLIWSVAYCFFFTLS